MHGPAGNINYNYTAAMAVIQALNFSSAKVDAWMIFFLPQTVMIKLNLVMQLRVKINKVLHNVFDVAMTEFLLSCEL